MESFIALEIEATIANVGAIVMALIVALSGGMLFWLRERT